MYKKDKNDKFYKIGALYEFADNERFEGKVYGDLGDINTHSAWPYESAGVHYTYIREFGGIVGEILNDEPLIDDDVYSFIYSGEKRVGVYSVIADTFYSGHCTIKRNDTKEIVRMTEVIYD